MEKKHGPEHYIQYEIEPWDFILINCIGYAEGNIIKYVCRWKYKNGTADLVKAIRYLEKLLKINGVDISVTIRGNSVIKQKRIK